MLGAIVAGLVLTAAALVGCQEANPPQAGVVERAPQEVALTTPSDIREAQRFLNTLGYRAGPVDGVIGSRTRSAISDYQTGNGLVQTGELTAALLDELRSKAMMYRATSPSRTAKAARSPRSSKPPSTTQVQSSSVAASDVDPEPTGPIDPGEPLGRVPQQSDPD